MFQIISLLIAIPCLLKAVTALLKADQFYGWRKQQYATATVPPIVLVMPTFAAVLAIAAWYATLFHYQAGGWIVTTFATLIAMIGLVNLSRWSTHRQKVGQAIATQPAKRKAVDITILLLGLFFVGLALFVYQ